MARQWESNAESLTRLSSRWGHNSQSLALERSQEQWEPSPVPVVIPPPRTEDYLQSPRLRSPLPQPSLSLRWNPQPSPQEILPQRLQVPIPNSLEPEYNNIEIVNELTGQEWHFRRHHALYSLSRSADYFTFNTFTPGLYNIENKTTQEVNVVLFNRSYRIEPNVKWQLVAHPQIESTALDWLEVGRIKEC